MAINNSLALELPRERTWLKDTLLVLGASVIIGLFAPVSIPLPFSPVPLATQMNVVLLLACILGSKRASLAVMAFLFQGAMGLPVLAGGRALVAIGPTCGYLLGYLAAAFVTGYIFERMKERTATKAFVAMGTGNLIVYLFGMSWLSQYIGWGSALTLGVMPFLIGDVFKLIVATKTLKFLRKI